MGNQVISAKNLMNVNMAVENHTTFNDCILSLPGKWWYCSYQLAPVSSTYSQHWKDIQLTINTSLVQWTVCISNKTHYTILYTFKQWLAYQVSLAT